MRLLRFAKKRRSERIVDPVIQYVQILHGSRKPKRNRPRTLSLYDRLIQWGYDSGFVYYED